MKFEAIPYFPRSFHFDHLSFNATLSSKGINNWVLIWAKKIFNCAKQEIKDRTKNKKKIIISIHIDIWEN